MPLMCRVGERRSPRGFWRALLAPAIGGLALALSFPPWGLWPLVFLAWVPLWLALSREAAGSDTKLSWRRPFLQGWVMGFVAFPIILCWLLALSSEEVTIPGLMIPSLFLLGLYLGLFFGLGALISRLLSRWSGLPLLAVAPAVTALLEFLRSLGPLGFPWAAGAYALARVTPMIQTGATLGFWGLLFLILAVNALVAAALLGRRWGLPAAAILLAGLWGYGEVVLAAHPQGRLEEDRRSLRVLVAQPDIRREIKWKPEKRGQVIQIVLEHGQRAARRGLAAGGFDLFIWPETVFPVRLLGEGPVLENVEAFTAALDEPVLVGTQEGYWHARDGERQWVCHNSVLLFYPDGKRSRIHRKMRLVPFSERMPLQKIAPWLGKIDFGQSDFRPGEVPVLLEMDGVRIGCLICFESAFPELSRSLVRRGANLLVVITNDFWFGHSAGPRQHADMSILRAVENRCALVRCANTGISFLVDPWGRVTQETQIFTQADFVSRVSVGAGSFASRHPGWAVKLLGAMVFLAVLAGLLRQSFRGRACRHGSSRVGGNVGDEKQRDRENQP